LHGDDRRHIADRHHSDIHSATAHAAVIDATIDLQCGMDNSEHVNMQGEHFEHTPEMYATQNNVCVRGVFRISVRRGDRSHWRRGLAPAQKKIIFVPKVITVGVWVHCAADINRQKTWTVTRSLGTPILRFVSRETKFTKNIQKFPVRPGGDRTIVP